ISVGDGFNQIEAGSGDDRISAGDGENDIGAGEGRNTIQVGDGENVVETGSGNDSIRLGDGMNEIRSSGGHNKVTVGDGNNEIQTGDGNDTIKLGDGFNYVDAGDGKNRIDAGKGENLIVAGTGDDSIRVKGAKNEIIAGDGNNTISAGNGDNLVRTGSGNDTIKLGNGTNSIFDQGGNNRITLGDGNAFIAVGDGKDDIRVGDGFVEIAANNGDKKISVGDGTANIYTKDGNDYITVGEGDVEIYAGGGNNRVTVKGGADITVGDGNNAIRTGDGYSQIEAGDGTNRIATGDGYSQVTTGSGRDDIRIGDGGSEVYAGSGNDKISAGDGHNQIHGGNGDDTIQTGDGDDEIWGGQGSDKISSGKGYDIVYYAGSFGDYVLSLSSSRVGVTSIDDSVSDAGSDQLTGVEALYFYGDGFLLDLTWEGNPDLVDDQISSLSESPLNISLSELLANDDGLPDNLPGLAVSDYSISGIRVTYDGENITYNADDVLQHLGAGELFEDSFTYTVVDPYGNSFDAVVNVSVTGENDGPIARNDLLIDETAPDVSIVEGPEFLVNLITAGSQDFQSVAVFEDRSSIIVWHNGMSSDEDPEGDGIRGRFVSPGGVPSGGEFQINSHADGIQTHPEVSVLENGNFVVTWMSGDNERSSNSYNIRARIFDPEGQPLGDDFFVNEIPDGYQGPPHITSLAGGGFTITWEAHVDAGWSTFYDVSNSGIALFDNEGQQVGEQIWLMADPNYNQPDTLIHQVATQIEALSGGGFVVVAQSMNNGHATDGIYNEHNIFLHFYDNAGNKISEIAVTGDSSPDVYNTLPTVDVGPDGQVLVMWDSYDRDAPGGSGYYARIFNEDGTETVSEFFVAHNSSTPHPPSVEWMDDGRFVLVYIDGIGVQSEVRLQVFNSDGSANSQVHVLDDPTNSHVASPEIASLGDGRFIVTWFGNYNDHDEFPRRDVVTQIVEVNGDISDSAYTDEDTAFSFNVADLLANDSDPEGDELTFSLDSTTSEFGAAISYDSDTGLLNYDPTSAADIQALGTGQAVEDTFTYTISDGHGGTDQATITIVVGGNGQVDVVLPEPGTTVVANDDYFGPEEPIDSTLEGGSGFQIVGPVERIHSSPAVQRTDDGGFVTIWATESGIVGRMSDATGQPSSDIFSITDNAVSLQQITMLQSGGFMVTYTEIYERTPTGPWGNFLDGVRGRVFSADGTPTGEEFWVSDGGTILTTDVSSLTELSNGNLAVARYTLDHENYEQQSLEVAIFTPTGQQVGAPIIFDTQIFGLHNDMSLEALPGGGFLATWATMNPAIDPDNAVISAAIFGNNGQVIQPEFTVSTSHDLYQWGHSNAVHEDGSFVVVWTSRDHSGLGNNILRASVFNPDGSVAAEEFTIDIGSTRVVGDFFSDVVFLPNGQFAVTWRGVNDEGDESGTRHFVQLFDQDGTAATDRLSMREDVTTERAGHPTIAVLDDDSFVLVWTAYNPSNGSFQSIESRVFDFNGNEIETAFSSEDEVSTFDVAELLANDDIPNPDELIFALSSANSANGAALSYDAASGMITYDPTAATDIQALNSGQVLEDSFIYTISNGLGDTDQATVSIIVGGVDEDTSVSLDLALASPLIDDIWG
ncbi:Ig-like domain-containing protein, partial [Parasedimentitalea huanghaiensis]